MSIVQPGILIDPDLLPRSLLSRSVVGRSATLTSPTGAGPGPEQKEIILQVSPTLIEQPWFNPLLERLGKFLSLEENWNGYGERRVHDVAVKQTVDVLNSICQKGPAPNVVPTSDGGVQIEWKDQGSEIEVEIPPSGPARILLVEPSGREIETTASARSNVWRLLQDRVARMRR